MSEISIKRVDLEFYRALKLAALTNGRTLRDECLLRLAQPVKEVQK